MQSLASNTNSVWLSVDYRLSPEFKFPTGLNDCKYVLDYVFKNKNEFSTDKAKLGISGDSCGAHYSALLSNQYVTNITYQS
jgi:acetyl esterase